MSAFMQRLSDDAGFNENLIEALRSALTGTKMCKADDLVSIISEASGEALA